jgi:hypothetical protein
MKIDLIHCIPEELAESARIEDLLETVRGIERWEDRQAEVLDSIYRLRVLRLVREGSVDEIRSLNRHLRQVVHRRRREALDRLSKAYGAQWEGYADLLESRLAALSSEVPVALIKGREHVREILRLVFRGEARTQGEIQRKLALQPANATRVLNLMEANELIKRMKVGREKLIFPGANAERLRGEIEGAEEGTGRPAATASAVTGERRGISFLSPSCPIAT